MIQFLCTSFNKFDVKLDEQIKLSNDFDTKLEVQNNKFDELKHQNNELKYEIQEINRQMCIRDRH